MGGTNLPSYRKIGSEIRKFDGLEELEVTQMKKEDVLSRINQGPMEYKDYGKIEFYTTDSESFPGEHYLHAKLFTDSPYCEDVLFGGCFLSDVTEEDCEKLDETFRMYRERIRRFDERAKSEPLALKEIRSGNGGGPYYRTPPINGKPGKVLRLENMKREDKGIDWIYLYVVSKCGENDYHFNYPVILDGQVYRPIYFYWLQHAYYDRNHPDGLPRENANGGAA